MKRALALLSLLALSTAAQAGTVVKKPHRGIIRGTAHLTKVGAVKAGHGIKKAAVAVAAVIY